VQPNLPPSVLEAMLDLSSSGSASNPGSSKSTHSTTDTRLIIYLPTQSYYYICLHDFIKLSNNNICIKKIIESIGSLHVKPP